MVARSVAAWLGWAISSLEWLEDLVHPMPDSVQTSWFGFGPQGHTTSRTNLNFGLHIVDGVRRFNLERDCLASQGL